MPIMIQNASKKLMCADHKIPKMYCKNDVIYSSGNIVTYMADNNVEYQEEVDEGKSCLLPQTFTPSKAGWEFVGWRKDEIADGTVLTDLIMSDEPVALYAVFRQSITLSYNGNGATSGSTAAQTGYRYYNNGNVAGTSFTLSANGFSRSGYNFSKWALGSAGGEQYSAGASVTLTEATTMYAVWTYVGAPYDIVRGGVGKQSLSWSLANSYNIDKLIVEDFYSGGNFPKVSANQDDDDEDSFNFTAVSSAIQTRGNRTMYIYGMSSAGGDSTVTVNGQTKKGGGTFDISNASSITIKVDAHSWTGQGQAFYQFWDLYLY